MKRENQIRLLVLFVIYFTVFPGLVHTAQDKLRVTAETAAVRVNPDIESQIITLMMKGEVLDSIDKTDGWFKVSVLLKEQNIRVDGYIHSSFVTALKLDSQKKEPEEKRILKETPTEEYSTHIDFRESRKRTWVGLKLKGGASYVLAGDINEGTEGFDNVWRDEFTYAGGEIQGKLTPFHIIYDFEGDFIFYILPNVGIGFGSGYLYGSQNNDMLLTFPDGEGSWVIKPELKVIPIKAGLYFLIPIGRNSCFSLDAGAGLYSVDYSWYWKGEYDGYWMEIQQQAAAKNVGYHAGLGFEIGWGSYFAFLVEGRARYAEISGFEGTLEYKDSYGDSDIDEGKLYYWKEQIFGNKYTFVFISESEAPSFTGLSSAELVREAVVDLSGFSLQAGFKLKF